VTGQYKGNYGLCVEYKYYHRTAIKIIWSSKKH